MKEIHPSQIRVQGTSRGYLWKVLKWLIVGHLANCVELMVSHDAKYAFPFVPEVLTSHSL